MTGTTTPVKYGEHQRPAADTPCIICGATEHWPFADHCHAHGWVRGPVCRCCNIAMSFIDRGITPRAAIRGGRTTLDDLIRHASRCPDCHPINAADLAPTRPIRPRTSRHGLNARFSAHESGPPVTAASPEWQHLARLVVTARVRLGYRTREALAAAAKVSYRTVGDLETARRTTYSAVTLRRVEQALRWLPGSVAAVLAGGDPTPAPAPAPVLPPAFARLLTVWRSLQPEQRLLIENMLNLLASGAEQHPDPPTTG